MRKRAIGFGGKRVLTEEQFAWIAKKWRWFHKVFASHAEKRERNACENLEYPYYKVSSLTLDSALLPVNTIDYYIASVSERNSKTVISGSTSDATTAIIALVTCPGLAPTPRFG